MIDITPEEAQRMKNRFVDEWPEVRAYVERNRAPDPCQPPTYRPRKSRYGRVNNVRIDRNTKAKDKTLAHARLGYPMKYKGG